MVPWSRSVTVMVVFVEPSAGGLVGLAATLEFAALAAGAWKVTEAGVRGTLSVVSLAVRLTDCAAVSVTVKVVWPFVSVWADEGPVTWVEQGDGVQFGLKVTALPLTGVFALSLRVTVSRQRRRRRHHCRVGGGGRVRSCRGAPIPGGNAAVGAVRLDEEELRPQVGKREVVLVVADVEDALGRCRCAARHPRRAFSQ